MEITQSTNADEHEARGVKVSLEEAAQVIVDRLFYFVNDTMDRIEKGENIEPARVSILPAMTELLLKYYLVT